LSVHVAPEKSFFTSTVYKCSANIARATLKIPACCEPFKNTNNIFFKWRPFWTQFRISWKASRRFSKAFSMLFCQYIRSYAENFSLLYAIFCLCFCLNEGHFGRHLGFLGKFQGDSPGLLLCCSTDISGLILKMSACYEKFSGFT